MSSPEFLRKDYRIDVMKIARKYCYDVNGNLNDLPLELQISILSTYYAYALHYMEMKKSVPPPFSKQSSTGDSILERTSKISHIISALNVIPEYILIYRQKKLSAEESKILVREITCDLIYGSVYSRFSCMTKVKYKIGILKPIIEVLINVRPLNYYKFEN
jgi:hypothetical protein